MKRFTLFSFIIAALICNIKLAAQELVVEPGYGTLNDAYTANGGSVTYVLKAGGWYGLSATIENKEPLTIVGQTSGDSAKMSPIIQMGTTASGGTFGTMFNQYADINFKNVFLVNADLNNSRGDAVFQQFADSKIILDKVTIDPIGNMFLVNVMASHSSIFITNSLIMRHSGEANSIWDWPLIVYNGTSGMDTLYVENSTFDDMGWSFYDAMISFQRGQADAFDKFIWFNHNTFLFGKSDIMNALYTTSTYFTNNLMYEWGIQPYYNDNSTWFLNYGDMGPKNTRTCLLRTDTVQVNGVNESFPSNRKYFAAYNYNHKDARINDLIKMLADSGRVAYSLPFISPASMKDSSREARIFNDKTNFPYFIASNNIDDQTNIDPNFVDKTIYSLKDSAVAWSYPSSEYVLGLSYPTQDTWPHYYVAPDSEIGYPVKWPRINGTYQNSQLMAGSIEGLPLGDLNWFPDKKAIWQAHQTEVMNHILNENISVINITSVKKSDNQVPNQFSLSQNYPNPFNPTTQIRYSISKNSLVTLKVYNLLGQEVTTLVNQQQKSGNYTVNFNASKLASGIYMYKIQAGEFSLTKKMTLLK